MKTFLSLALIGCIMLTGCDKANTDTLIISEFKNTDKNNLDQCVGPMGKIEWSVNRSPKTTNPSVVLITADMTNKSQEKFTVQYLFNTESKVASIEYAGNGEPTSKFAGALGLGTFCMKGML